MDSGGKKNNPTQGIEPVEKSAIAKREEEILEFWRTRKIFEKTQERTEGQEEFIFYDGAF